MTPFQFEPDITAMTKTKTTLKLDIDPKVFNQIIAGAQLVIKVGWCLSELNIALVSFC